MPIFITYLAQTGNEPIIITQFYNKLDEPSQRNPERRRPY